MDLVPAVPGLQEGVDPFADPLIGKGFDNFPVVKIGNVSSPFASWLYRS